MREQLLGLLKMVVDFDSADFHLSANDGSKKLVDPVMYNLDENMSAIYDELDYSRGIMYSGKSIVYRETDIISEEVRLESEYYKKVYVPNNWHYSLQMVLAVNKDFLGVITFYRTIGKENFQYDDIFVLDMLKEHLSYRLYEDRNEEKRNEEKLSIAEAIEKFQLTKREHTILQLLVDGEENESICKQISISVNTLKKHILNIYRKLGISNRVQMFKLIKDYQ
jgi:DNA-binding CsgD family transcriptional regulator